MKKENKNLNWKQKNETGSLNSVLSCRRKTVGTRVHALHLHSSNSVEASSVTDKRENIHNELPWKNVLHKIDFVNYQFIFTTVLRHIKAIQVIIFTTQTINKKKPIKASMHMTTS